MTSPPAVRCPACGSGAVGRFCAACGARLQLGAPDATARHTRTLLPWIGVGFVLVVAVVTFSIRKIYPRPANAAAIATMPASDIASLSTRERAGRLYDRIMRLHGERKVDSVGFFAQMALASYAAIPDIDTDARYDMARVAMVAQALDVAAAQSDAILKSDQNHLLGLLLSADIARARGEPSKAIRAEQQFIAAAPRERARRLAEYEAHAFEIEDAVRRLSQAIRRP